MAAASYKARCRSRRMHESNYFRNDAAADDEALDYRRPLTLAAGQRAAAAQGHAGTPRLRQAEQRYRRADFRRVITR